MATNVYAPWLRYGDMSGEADVLNHVQQSVAGSQQMANEPGVIYSLQVAQAQPQDAQGIGQFLDGLQTSNQVHAARLSGRHINLTSDDRTGLALVGGGRGDYESECRDVAR